MPQAQDAGRDDSLRGVVKRLGPAAVLGAVWAVLPALGGFAVLYYMSDISTYLREHQSLGFWLYVVIFIFSAGFGLLPTYSQAVLAGFAFGIGYGFVGALAGFTGAAMIGYVIARSVARERVEAEIATHPKARVVRDALVGRSFWGTLGIATLVRLPPNSPFALSNLVLTGVGVPKRVYVLATLIGLSPRTFAAVYIGSQVSEWSEVEKPKYLIIGGVVLTIVVLIIIGQIAQNALKKFAERSGEPTPDS